MEFLKTDFSEYKQIKMHQNFLRPHGFHFKYTYMQIEKLNEKRNNLTWNGCGKLICVLHQPLA